MMNIDNSNSNSSNSNSSSSSSNSNSNSESEENFARLFNKYKSRISKKSKEIKTDQQLEGKIA